MKPKSVCSKMFNAIGMVAFFCAVTFLIPVFSFAQGGPGGPGEGGGGTNPDGAVPFDDNMNIAFLTAGVLFAAFIVYKKMQKKSTLS